MILDYFGLRVDCAGTVNEARVAGPQKSGRIWKALEKRRKKQAATTVRTSVNRGVVVTDAGSYLRLIDSCITQRKAQGPSMTFNESKEEEEAIPGR